MTTRNFDNRTLFVGDNIDYLRAMNSETVDLVATDPPFAKGRDFHAAPDSLAAGASFQDSWKWDEESHPRFVNALEDDPKHKNVWMVIQSARASWGDDMGAFLCFMGVRLLEMRRLLKPMGSIYLHCDPTASHYLKTLMDAVFGRQNFKNEIVWDYKKVSNSGAKKFNRAHDIILFYVKSKTGIFNRQYESELSGRKQALIRAGYNTKRMNGERYLYIYDEDTVEEKERSGKINRDDFDHVRYVDVTKGNVLTDVFKVDHLNSQSKENVGYPTQKPLALYERMIRASSNEGDLVLDPFAGCATTAVAAERLGRQWVGMDLWPNTVDLTIQRLHDEKRMFAVENLSVVKTPPDRTDEGEVESPDLELEMSRQLEKWQRLYKSEIVDHLREAQSNATGLVVCAGCGRELEIEFMELDHIFPSAEGGENGVTNRILLCLPCNGKKSNTYTLAGLRKANKRGGWMRDEASAESAQVRARRKADMIKAE